MGRNPHLLHPDRRGRLRRTNEWDAAVGSRLPVERRRCRCGNRPLRRTRERRASGSERDPRVERRPSEQSRRGPLHRPRRIPRTVAVLHRGEPLDLLRRRRQGHERFHRRRGRFGRVECRTHPRAKEGTSRIRRPVRLRRRLEDRPRLRRPFPRRRPEAAHRLRRDHPPLAHKWNQSVRRLLRVRREHRTGRRPR